MCANMELKSMKVECRRYVYQIYRTFWPLVFNELKLGKEKIGE